MTITAQPFKCNYTNNRQPLVQKDYMELPIGAIEADGWLKEQLLRMKSGFTGNLDIVYEKVMGTRNGWLGGDGDVWERGPYWIDGLLPLAYILDDQELKNKVQPWIEWALDSQKPDGYFGPDTDREPEPGLQRTNARDWWPKMVMLKVMQQYYNATGDERVIPFLTNYFRYQLEVLPKTPLGTWTYWGQRRGGDNLMVIYWLYNITGDEFLLQLAELVHKQTFDWTGAFLERDILRRQHTLHTVNLGQGFKEPVIYYQRSHDHKHIEAVKTAVSDMRYSIGLPNGLWAGDEKLRFGSPNAGTELCTIVEMMFSLEKILEITGDVQWADHLERVAYNALPTHVNDDYTARQYYQQINQVSVTRDWKEFSTPHEDTDILFGELTGYPCCTSNMHQGWPKFVQNLWYATEDMGLAALVYAPSNVSAKVADGVVVNVSEDTAYPFEETIRFRFSFDDRKIKKAFFPFHIRIPQWCTDPVVRINGEIVEVDAHYGTVAKISREWRNGDVLTLELPMEVTVSQWYDKGAVVERGPLVYALKMDEKWEKKYFEDEKKDEYGSWYYEVTSSSPWNYGFKFSSFAKDRINETFIVEKTDSIADYPWNVDDAPVMIKAKAVPMNNWKMIGGSAGPISFYARQGRDYSDAEEIVLIPYGCTTLRIALFPVR